MTLLGVLCTRARDAPGQHRGGEGPGTHRVWSGTHRGLSDRWIRGTVGRGRKVLLFARCSQPLDILENSVGWRPLYTPFLPRLGVLGRLWDGFPASFPPPPGADASLRGPALTVLQGCFHPGAPSLSRPQPSPPRRPELGLPPNPRVWNVGSPNTAASSNESCCVYCLEVQEVPSSAADKDQRV